MIFEEFQISIVWKQALPSQDTSFQRTACHICQTGLHTSFLRGVICFCVVLSTQMFIYDVICLFYTGCGPNPHSVPELQFCAWHALGGLSLCCIDLLWLFACIAALWQGPL